MMGMMGMVRLGEKRGLMEIIWDSHTRIRLDGDYFMWIIWLLLRFSCFFLMVDKGYLRIYSQENRRDLAGVSPS
jgi:hypothetical protein